MYTSKSYNSVFRNQYRVFFLVASSVMFLLLPLISAHAAEKDKEISGTVDIAPGLFWPIGIWKVENNRVMVTEQTTFKGDKSKAIFGANISAKGYIVDGIFTAVEIEVRTNEDHLIANK